MIRRYLAVGSASGLAAVVTLALAAPPAPALRAAGLKRPVTAVREGAHRPVRAAELAGPVYTAHRGGALEHLENSMSGLRAALASGHAQVLDFDTRMLRDGTLVVIHDATLDRTTDGTGPVKDLTAAEWAKVRLVPPPALRGRIAPERPPTVAEVLDEFGGRAVLMLEAKDPASVGRIAREIHGRGLADSVFVNTNRPAVAREVHRRGLLTQLWRSRRQMRGDRPAEWAGFVDVLDVDHRARGRDLRRFALSGVPWVWGHTVNTARARDRAARYGCNGFITDAPGLLAGRPVR